MNELKIQVKSSNGIAVIPAESRLLAERTVFVEGQINAETACGFVKKIMLLNQEDDSSPIRVLINSTGGEINSGMLMYDVIQASKAPIQMYCIGRAYSMAAVLLACGGHGRYILPHSEMMIHEPLLGNSIGGTSSSIRSVSETLQATKRMLDGILARHTGRSEQEVEQATSYDHFFTPEESVKFGLCDEITTFDKIIGGKV